MIELTQRIEVRGERNKHLGPTWQRAAAILIVEPADGFAIDGVGPEGSTVERDVYARSFALGALDALKVDGNLFLDNVRLAVSGLEVDPVDSSANAFREAGLGAGRRAAEIWRAEAHGSRLSSS